MDNCYYILPNADIFLSDVERDSPKLKIYEGFDKQLIFFNKDRSKCLLVFTGMNEESRWLARNNAKEISKAKYQTIYSSFEQAPPLKTPDKNRPDDTELVIAAFNSEIAEATAKTIIVPYAEVAETTVIVKGSGGLFGNFKRPSLYLVKIRQPGICPGCGRNSFMVKEEKFGKDGICKACGHKIDGYKSITSCPKCLKYGFVFKGATYSCMHCKHIEFSD